MNAEEQFAGYVAGICGAAVANNVVTNRINALPVDKSQDDSKSDRIFVEWFNRLCEVGKQ